MKSIKFSAKRVEYIDQAKAVLSLVNESRLSNYTKHRMKIKLNSIIADLEYPATDNTTAVGIHKRVHLTIVRQFEQDAKLAGPA